MRELFCVLKQEDSEGIKHIVLVDKENLIPNLKMLRALLDQYIIDLVEEREAIQGVGSP